jgi:hypothetical protein
MCVVCKDLILQKMSWFEAEINLNELGRLEKKRDLATHYQDLFDAFYNMDLEKIDKLTDEGLKC